MDLLKYPSLIVLIIANLVPLYGAYAWGWSVGELMLLYWSESAIIGFFNILKMVLSSNGPISFSGSKIPLFIPLKLFYIPFFTVHYGGFMLGHLVFIVTLFVKDFSVGLLLTVLIGMVSLFISHGLSFFMNYVGKKEYGEAFIGTLMFAPYPRIVVMHLTIIFGAFINAPLILLIAGKTIADAFSHLKEREGYLHGPKV